LTKPSDFDTDKTLLQKWLPRLFPCPNAVDYKYTNDFSPSHPLGLSPPLDSPQNWGCWHRGGSAKLESPQVPASYLPAPLISSELCLHPSRQISQRQNNWI